MDTLYAYINDGEKIGNVIDFTQPCVTGEIADFTRDLKIENRY